MIIVWQTGELTLEEMMAYECPFPPALFETKDILRKADKPALAEAIRSP